MKTLLLILIMFLSGCSTLSLSDAIRRDAVSACENTPENGGQRLGCEFGHIYRDCLINGWDAKICGEIGRK
jgi:hypothetical protein